MEYVSLAAALLAVVIALAARARAAAMTARLDQSEAAGRSAAAQADEANQRTARLEQFVRRMADGKPVSGSMIEEGRLFDEVDAERARAQVEGPRGAQTLVLDVRTEQEVRGGHIPGALWIPVDQLESRAREVPKDRPVLVVCAAGGRSAAACDYLTGRGHENVVNVIGGMSSWRGKTAAGLPVPAPPVA